MQRAQSTTYFLPRGANKRMGDGGLGSVKRPKPLRMKIKVLEKKKERKAFVIPLLH